MLTQKSRWARSRSNPSCKNRRQSLHCRCSKNKEKAQENIFTSLIKKKAIIQPLYHFSSQRFHDEIIPTAFRSRAAVELVFSCSGRKAKVPAGNAGFGDRSGSLAAAISLGTRTADGNVETCTANTEEDSVAIVLSGWATNPTGGSWIGCVRIGLSPSIARDSTVDLTGAGISTVGTWKKKSGGGGDVWMFEVSTICTPAGTKNDGRMRDALTKCEPDSALTNGLALTRSEPFSGFTACSVTRSPIWALTSRGGALIDWLVVTDSMMRIFLVESGAAVGEVAKSESVSGPWALKMGLEMDDDALAMSSGEITAVVKLWWWSAELAVIVVALLVDEWSRPLLPRKSASVSGPCALCSPIGRRESFASLLTSFEFKWEEKTKEFYCNDLREFFWFFFFWKQHKILPDSQAFVKMAQKINNFTFKNFLSNRMFLTFSKGYFDIVKFDCQSGSSKAVDVITHGMSK